MKKLFDWIEGATAPSTAKVMFGGMALVAIADVIALNLKSNVWAGFILTAILVVYYSAFYKK